MYFVKYIYFRKRHLKCGPFDKNVVILETFFWWGQIAFVCRGQKVGESSCLVVKVSGILKSKFHFREQNWNGLADYFCTPKWDTFWSTCFGIFSLSYSLIILKNTPIQNWAKNNKNQQSQSPNNIPTFGFVSFLFFFSPIFKGMAISTGLLTCYLFWGPHHIEADPTRRIYWNWISWHDFFETSNFHFTPFWRVNCKGNQVIIENTPRIFLIHPMLKSVPSISLKALCWLRFSFLN